MSKFRDGFSWGFGAIVGCIMSLFALGLGLYGALLHLFSVASIWTVHGATIGIVSFFLPGIAEIYLLFKAAAVSPLGWGNNYTYHFSLLVAGLLAYLAIRALASQRPRKGNGAESGEGGGMQTVDCDCLGCEGNRLQCRDGMTPEDVIAAKLYREAAEQGDASAQCNLANCYFDGEGVPQDYTEAVKWNRKAAAQGNAVAEKNLGVLYENGLGVPQDHLEAAKWYQRAANQGLAGAQNDLGVCYETGRGVKQDYHEAVKWYRKAAEQGEVLAQINLGNCYKLGKGVPQDYSEAAKSLSHNLVLW